MSNTVNEPSTSRPVPEAWTAATLFCADPVVTGRFYAAFGLPIRAGVASHVEIPAPSGPTLRLVKSCVSSRTYAIVRVTDFSSLEERLTELGVAWEAKYPICLRCKDPDGNTVVANAPRPRLLSNRFSMWQMYVPDVRRTKRWFRDTLGVATTREDDRVRVIEPGSGPSWKLDPTSDSPDADIFFQPPALLLFPARDKGVTVTELGIEVSDLPAVAYRLAASRWEYESPDTATLITQSPDGWNIRLTASPA